MASIRSRRFPEPPSSLIFHHLRGGRARRECLLHLRKSLEAVFLLLLTQEAELSHLCKPGCRKPVNVVFIQSGYAASYKLEALLLKSRKTNTEELLVTPSMWP